MRCSTRSFVLVDSTKCVAQVVEHGRFDAVDVPVDFAAELDESGDAGSLRPGPPLEGIPVVRTLIIGECVYG